MRRWERRQELVVRKQDRRTENKGQTWRKLMNCQRETERHTKTHVRED